ncbi:coiled-coil domain-containing protein 40 isoform X1 [Anolis carolinensis]|uniref:coiled-coil domain-containing protein 40 isoform X1 n=1 Tax=Anolis carolinensis TaxID=28377 RepID=UPI002F2B811C
MDPGGDAAPEHGEIKDEKKELLAEDEAPEDIIANEEDAGNAPTEEGEKSTRVAIVEEETEAIPAMATEEATAVAPAADAEEEAAISFEATMEERAGVASATGTEEEATVPVAAAMEEGLEAAPEKAIGEEAVVVAAATTEEGAEFVPAMPTEEEPPVISSVPTEEGPTVVPSMPPEEGPPVVPAMPTEKGPPVVHAVFGEERLLGKTLSVPRPDIYEYRESPFGQVSEILADTGSLPSRLYSEAMSSSASSTASSLRFEIPEQRATSGATLSVAVPSYSGSAFQPSSLQFGSFSPMEDHGNEDRLQVTDRELGGGEAEEETQLVVLDPEHPLMKRFQSALKAYLNKQIGKLTDEVCELTASIKHGKGERENLGVILYGVQQQLARLQMELEKNHNCHSQIAMARRQLEEELHDLRKTYKAACESTEDERKRVSAMQTEIEKLSMRLFYMQNMDKDVRDDMAVMKRIVNKADMERMHAEIEKQKQDLHVDRLTKRVNELEEQIALYEAQYMAQSEDTNITRKEVAEAITEIQAIQLEKKQLLRNWAGSLTGMKHRDEAYAAMQAALLESRHKLKALEIEIEVYKKSITKEEERNELLASLLNRAENDGNTSRKLISQCLAKQDAMKVEFGTYTRALQETEQALIRANMDQASRTKELAILRKEIEKGSETKQELENEIISKLQDHLMSNKAARYYLQLGVKLQDQLMALDIQLTKVENDTAQTELNITNTSCKLNMFEKTLSDVDSKMDNLNKQISHSEAEIAKRNLLIGRKQGVINLYNKKLEMLISQLGGQELGPLEIEIKKLTKHIDDIELEVEKLQREWLIQQKELVKLTQERDGQLSSLDMLKKEITIKEQKKVRIENEIQQEKNELKDIERHMKNMANDLVKLHLLINKNREDSEELQQGNTLMENEFVRSLKASEKESIQMQEKLDRLQEEKERLLNSLVEAECQMMQWEKKIQLAKEMRAAVDSETGQGEIRAMKSEIHRMQVRYQQLMKQQEKLMRDTEAAVARRESIVIRAEAESKLNKQLLTKGDFHHKKLELKKKIKETQKNAEECNKTLNQLETAQRNVGNALLEKQDELAILNSEIEDLEVQADKLLAKKRQNLADIVSSQARMKHLQAVKEGKYNPLCRSEIMIRVERQKIDERLHAISIILYQVGRECPHYQRTLQKINQILKKQFG